MKPARFSYVAADSLDHALEVLDEIGDVAKVIAGGQSLGPLLNLRLAFTEALVDINSLVALDYVREADRGELRLGALTRHHSIERSPVVASGWPALVAAVGQIGHRAIRNRGTIGGSVVHADPSAELPATLIALDATFYAASVRGVRSIAARSFFLGPFTTVLEPNELLVEIRVPHPARRSGQAWVEFCRRPGDFGVVGVAASVEFDRKRRCAAGTLVYSGVESTPWEFEGGSELLQKTYLTPQLAQELGRAAARDCSPSSDDHASAAFRKHLVGILTERVLTQCAVTVDGRGG